MVTPMRCLMKKTPEMKIWLSKPLAQRPKPKTSHTTSKVPLFIFDPRGHENYGIK